MHVFGIKFPIGQESSNPLAIVHGSPFEIDDFYELEFFRLTFHFK